MSLLGYEGKLVMWFAFLKLPLGRKNVISASEMQHSSQIIYFSLFTTLSLPVHLYQGPILTLLTGGVSKT